MSISNSASEKVLGRILTFSDGVFAIAILLLLIDIRLPAETTSASLGAALLELWPGYLAFFLSFVVIGLYWTAHVRLFRDIVRYDWVLVWLNMLYLLFIVIIPFATSVLSNFSASLSAVIYAANVACAGYMNTVLRLYAMTGRRLVNYSMSRRYVRKNIILSLIAPVGFTIAIGIAFINSFYAMIFWIAVALAHIVSQRFLKPGEG